MQANSISAAAEVTISGWVSLAVMSTVGRKEPTSDGVSRSSSGLDTKTCGSTIWAGVVDLGARGVDEDKAASDEDSTANGLDEDKVASAVDEVTRVLSNRICSLFLWL